ncbi:MAG: DUF4861 domain-containing protein [Tannerella sp.]|jgi:hypothetical protein|nr:DUF4861 domain-containing protein [Tannerella sp.]
MKKGILVMYVVALVSCARQEKTFHFTVENPGSFDRPVELVEIPLDALPEEIRPGERQTYVLRNDRQETLPIQITYDGKLIFQPGLNAGEKAAFTLSTGVSQTFTPKTRGRFITERKDDFAWENDRVAFRIYGPALLEVDGPSNGLDLWYKRTDRLIIDKWYKDDLAGVRSYHTDHGEGLDDYKVGRTLGGGMMAPYAGNRLWLNENFVRQEILENGPLRTTFRLIYKDLTVDGKTFGESRIFSLDAGAQLTKVTQVYGTDETIPVAAGIVQRGGADEMVAHVRSNEVASLVYAEPPSESVGNVYVGLVFPNGLDTTATTVYTLIHPKTGKEETHSHVLAVTSYRPGCPITYYAGYGWSKFGFSQPADFHTYIERFVESLTHPLVVKW